MYCFVFSFEFLIDHLFPSTFLSAMYQREVCKHLEALDLMRMETTYQNNLEAQQTVLEQMKLKKNNALSNGGPLNLDGCGPSSIQIFAGEDQDYPLRTKQQQQQVYFIISTIP